MANQLRNATFLDGIADWQPTSGNLGVDQAVLGARGRHVLVNAGGGARSASAVPVVQGRPLEAFVAAWAPGGPPSVDVLVGGVVIAAVPMTAKADGRGARRGVPGSFYQYRLPPTPSPSTGVAELRITGAGGQVAITKPFLDGDARLGHPQCWQAGPHTNLDLNLPAWPSILPQINMGDFNAQATPMRAGYDSDSGIPFTRMRKRTPWSVVQGTVRLNFEQRDVLDQFWLSGIQPFWFVRHDTMQLMRTRWHPDGDPTDQGDGPQRATSFQLLCAVP